MNNMFFVLDLGFEGSLLVPVVGARAAHEFFCEPPQRIFAQLIGLDLHVAGIRLLCRSFRIITGRHEAISRSLSTISSIAKVSNRQ